MPKHRTYSRRRFTAGFRKPAANTRPGCSLAKGGLIKDDEGRDRLRKAMPRFLRCFSDLANQPGWTFLGSSAWAGCNAALCFSSDKEERASEQKWRTVGTIRRYILLILTLAQTVVATRYMKTILPYRGWALINLSVAGGAGYLDSPLCSSCLHATNRYPDDFVCRAVLLGVSPDSGRR